MGVSQSTEDPAQQEKKTMAGGLMTVVRYMMPSMTAGSVLAGFMGFGKKQSKGCREKPYQIVLVGLDGAGKTTLTQRFKVVHKETVTIPSGAPGSNPVGAAAATCGGDDQEMGSATPPSGSDQLPPEDEFRREHVEPAPTIGLNLQKVQLSESCVVEVWDLGGQQSMRHLWQHYLYDKIDLLVFMVDCADQDRIPIAMEELARLQNSADLKRSSPYTLVLLNKSDMLFNPASGAMSQAEFNTQFLGPEVLAQAESSGYPLCVKSLSALTGEGVDSVVQWISSSLGARNESGESNSAGAAPTTTTPPKPNTTTTTIRATPHSVSI